MKRERERERQRATETKKDTERRGGGFINATPLLVQPKCTGRGVVHTHSISVKFA